MHRVNQTNTNLPGGNCFQACVASLLELPLEDVPNFCNAEPANEWYLRLSTWLAERGLGCGYADLRKDDPVCVSLDGLCILGVEHEKHTDEHKANGWCHAIVGVAAGADDGRMFFECVFDPNPAQYRISRILDVTWIISNASKDGD